MGVWQIPMEDGAIVAFDHQANIVDIGHGLGVPTKFSYEHPGGPDQPSILVEFGVMEGNPVCLGIHLGAKDGVPVRTKDLRVAHIDKLIISAVGAVAFEATPSERPGHRGWRKNYGDAKFNERSVKAGQAIVRGKPRTRRNPADLDLELVAETWRNAAEGARTEALMEAFFCSKATAARYKKRAVEEGLLDG